MGNVKILKLLQFSIVISLCFELLRAQNSAPSTCRACIDDNTCIQPNCYCCRNELQLPMTVSDIPQIVFFTFDDALTDQVAGFYDQLFDSSRKNPNGCPISMTMFISHNNTKYQQVNKFYKKGMEIAAHSVTHHHMTENNFYNEAKLQKKYLSSLGGIPESDIVGWRSPFLEPVGDYQPDKLKELGYVYDSTLTFSKRSLNNKAPTPFTLDYGWPYNCQVKPCPAREHVGFWEVPIVSLIDYKHKYDCVYVDGCMNAPPDENSAYNFLMDNFNSYYSKSRVPFGINMHPSWFFYPDRLKAMDRFILELSNRKDVYIVSIKQMIAWLKNPVALSQAHSFNPWSCSGSTSTRNSISGVASSHNRRTNILPPPSPRNVNAPRVQTLHTWQQKFTETGRRKKVKAFGVRGSKNRSPQLRIQNGVIQIPKTNRAWSRGRQNTFRNQNRPRPVTVLPHPVSNLPLPASVPTLSSPVSFNSAQNTIIRQSAVRQNTRNQDPIWHRGDTNNQVTQRTNVDNNAWWTQPQPQINVIPTNNPTVQTTQNQRNALSFEQQQLNLLQQQEQQHLLQQRREEQILREKQRKLERQLELKKQAEKQRLIQEQERQRQINLENERKQRLNLQDSLRAEADRRRRLREEKLRQQQRAPIVQQTQPRQQHQVQPNRQDVQTVKNTASTRRAIQIWQKFVKYLMG